MTQSTTEPLQLTGHVSTIYGPVKSWRYGYSLGVDLIRDISTCSFNCIYCQLGNIQVKTIERKNYVETQQVLNDLENSDWKKADIITFSGSGEPTLAANLKEILAEVKTRTHKPTLVLTNATTLHLPEVQEALMLSDNVAVKLDAPDDATFQQMNRPVDGVSLSQIIEAIKAFKKIYKGKLSVQSMFMPANIGQAQALAKVIKEIQPDELQLNTPKRPYPLSWHVDSRGNHVENPEYKTVKLNTISIEQANEIEALLKAETGVKVLSIYPNQ